MREEEAGGAAYKTTFTDAQQMEMILPFYYDSCDSDISFKSVYVCSAGQLISLTGRGSWLQQIQFPLAFNIKVLLAGISCSPSQTAGPRERSRVPSLHPAKPSLSPMMCSRTFTARNGVIKEK